MVLFGCSEAPICEIRLSFGAGTFVRLRGLGVRRLGFAAKSVIELLSRAAAEHSGMKSRRLSRNKDTIRRTIGLPGFDPAPVPSLDQNFRFP